MSGDWLFPGLNNIQISKAGNLSGPAPSGLSSGSLVPAGGFTQADTFERTNPLFGSSSASLANIYGVSNLTLNQAVSQLSSGTSNTLLLAAQDASFMFPPIE